MQGGSWYGSGSGSGVAGASCPGRAIGTAYVRSHRGAAQAQRRHGMSFRPFGRGRIPRLHQAAWLRQGWGGPAESAKFWRVAAVWCSRGILPRCFPTTAQGALPPRCDQRIRVAPGIAVSKVARVSPAAVATWTRYASDVWLGLLPHAGSFGEGAPATNPPA